ncbi:hypothetical protein EST38_g6546 [Candolleomyces aberdarensis]|uniref:Nephrocystin 3-like N-terminal domain-containing protein n=1 Tax=Candolleomyces aberdarensis TaxID=2316362 RepID=A0A4Q2DJH0_9AGAR|nr:hypothetical protein EST38_g6546 [Candolleomyces aberdarensis]
MPIGLLSSACMWMPLIPDPTRLTLVRLPILFSTKFFSQQALLLKIEGWERLMQETSPNALYNSRHRFAPPKCDEDTRVDVTEEVMDWIQDREAPTRILCMTGAAGSGKSALQQTIAERCSRLDILASTFFFSTSDPTRNTILNVIPTIAYQMGISNPNLKRVMGERVANDPFIFSKSLETQLNALIVDPVERLLVEGRYDVSSLQYAILIDGLDECSNEDDQAALLAALKECLLNWRNSPFRLFVSSRPEWAIRSALDDNAGGYLHKIAHHIPLSDKYDATSDIRQVLWRRLRELQSRNRQSHSKLWPTKEDVEALVVAASGQFIYAATVLKYISERRGSPVDRLRMVLTWTSADSEDAANPLSPLDRLYTNILSNAKRAYEAVSTDNDHDNFLLILRTYELIGSTGPWHSIKLPVHVLGPVLHLDETTHEVLISDLHSLVTTEETAPGEVFLRFYHKSFLDFFNDESRAKSLFIPKSMVDEWISLCCIEHIVQFPIDAVADIARSSTSKIAGDDFETFTRSYSLLPSPKSSSVQKQASVHQLTPALRAQLLYLTSQGGLEKVDDWLAGYKNIKEYTQHYKNMVDRWTELTGFLLNQLGDVEPSLLAVISKYHIKWKREGELALKKLQDRRRRCQQILSVKKSRFFKPDGTEANGRADVFMNQQPPATNNAHDDLDAKANASPSVPDTNANGFSNPLPQGALDYYHAAVMNGNVVTGQNMPSPPTAYNIPWHQDPRYLVPTFSYPD